MPTLVIAAGGTGGHMFPAQALAEVLQSEGWKVALSTDVRGSVYTKNFLQETDIRVANAARFGGGMLAKVGLPIKLVRSVLSEIRWMRQINPDVVIGLGGYPSFPALSAARLLRVPSLIHEQNSVLGRANRLFASSVKTVACGLPLIRAPQKAKTLITGNPLRQSALSAIQAYDAPSDQGPFNVLCFGGSQGASVFSTLIPDMLRHMSSEMRGRVDLTLQVRPDDCDSVKTLLQSYALRRFDVEPFFSDMPQRIAQAHLVIARAGASTLAEITAIGRPAFIVPLPTAMDDHQTANATALEQAGAAKVYKQAQLTAQILARDIEALTPDALKNMATAAKTLGKLDATQRLAALVKSIVKER